MVWYMVTGSERASGMQGVGWSGGAWGTYMSILMSMCFFIVARKILSSQTFYPPAFFFHFSIFYFSLSFLLV